MSPLKEALDQILIAHGIIKIYMLYVGKQFLRNNIFWLKITNTFCLYKVFSQDVKITLNNYF